ncbi:redoxin family protein [Nitratireductor sp. L1-7-SE]|uniref:Redoxin family protein n=1 Tax=Nitratireductor rhodophyticola TaxID=2854036 RepID=A0ABS7R870_9HYPH|nr:TlpA disulfide reductase family protein [Nitratireductor rhodophyticola]MBY8915653.1 redoxin family protein [Nitratireductor rhodophyticola]MBY8919278.1 redoxin family protein [Nitratireductor rhodophyticola]
MNAVSLGPLVLAADRFAVVLAIFVFLIVTGIMARKVDDRFNAWSWWAFLGGIIGARLGHVLINMESFVADPLRIFAVWQGGFYWPTGAAAVIVSLLVMLPTGRQRLWAALPLALSLIVWNTTWQLTGGTDPLAVPDQVFETLEGNGYRLEERKGTPQVVNLWATWCPPCRREMPMMADIAASTDDVTFVFANQGEGRTAIQRYLAASGLSLDTILVDQFSDLSRFYSAPGLPATLFIDADGVLQHAHLGEISREVLVEKIENLRTSISPSGDTRP